MEASALRRLEELRAERMTGVRRLDELAREFDAVRETVLRIGGAIQVLEELLADGTAPADTGALPTPVNAAAAAG
jgi:hypothetical protein